jgi:hypothetical protein
MMLLCCEQPTGLSFSQSAAYLGGDLVAPTFMNRRAAKKWAVATIETLVASVPRRRLVRSPGIITSIRRLKEMEP